MSAFERAAIDSLLRKAEAAGVPVPDELRALLACADGSTGAMLFADQYPDAEQLGCCYGEVHRGLAGCTCWRPEYDTDQAPPQTELVTAEGLQVRAGGRCGDCAYRPDSPENAEPWTADQLVESARSGRPFWCHDGMRRPARWRHPERDVTVEGSTADWRPPVIGEVPFRADGRPGLLCAGWASEGRRQARIAAQDQRDHPEAFQ